MRFRFDPLGPFAPSHDHDHAMTNGPPAAHNFIMLGFLLLITLAFALGETSSRSSNDVVMRWASTGGGWRSQFACVGFAKLFGQVGLLPNSSTDASTTTTSRKLSAISTTSGASWFSTQLFYSPEFYQRTVGANNGDSLFDFVVDWMNAYHELSVRVIQEQRDTISPQEVERTCDTSALGGGDFVQVLSDLCGTLLYFEGDWAKLVQDMLNATSASYGHDGFASTMAGTNNRVPQLANTDLLIQSAIVPNSRIRSNTAAASDTAVYLGPKENGGLYALPLTAAYIVNSSSTRFVYSHQSHDLKATNGPVSSEHAFSDWESFHLFPADNGTVLIKEGAVDSYPGDIARSLQPPFGGDSEQAATVTQIAAISSAAAGAFSPLVPSLFTQGLSEQRYFRESQGGLGGIRLFEQAVGKLYSNSLFDNFAVCSQWPMKPCGSNDGHYVDGAYTDNPALAINVGQYQTSQDFDIDKKLKIVLTNTNQEWGSEFQYAQFLQYWDSPVNRGVEPGHFNWPASLYVPHQSPQLFLEYMDRSALDKLILPIEGSNMTTAILKGTTVENKEYGVRPGQSIEILLINLNENISTYVVTPNVIEFFTVPLANMTKNIAENKELKRRLELFFENPQTATTSVGSCRNSFLWMNAIAHLTIFVLLATCS